MIYGTTDRVPIKIQLGDKTLLAPKLWLQLREAGLDDEALPVAEPTPPADALQGESQRFLVRSLRVIGKTGSQRNFWPLSEGEAKLVQLIVLPELGDAV